MEYPTARADRRGSAAGRAALVQQPSPGYQRVQAALSALRQSRTAATAIQWIEQFPNAQYGTIGSALGTGMRLAGVYGAAATVAAAPEAVKREERAAAIRMEADQALHTGFMLGWTERTMPMFSTDWTRVERAGPLFSTFSNTDLGWYPYNPQTPLTGW